MGAEVWILGERLDADGKHLFHAGGGGNENGYASHLSDYTARGGSHSNSETWVEVGCCPANPACLCYSSKAMQKAGSKIRVGCIRAYKILIEVASWENRRKP